MSDCIFCKIVAKEIPAKIVYEDDILLAFHDIKPSAPIHVLLVPKKHFEWQTLSPEGTAIISQMFLVAPKIAREVGVYDSGFKLVVNCGEGAGQTISHFHLHLLGGWAGRPKLRDLA